MLFLILPMAFTEVQTHDFLFIKPNDLTPRLRLIPLNFYIY